MKNTHRILSAVMAVAMILSIAIFPASSVKIDPNRLTADYGVIIFDSAEKIEKYIPSDYEIGGVELSFDEKEQALKVEVTGSNPHFYIDWADTVSRKLAANSIDYVYTVYKAPLTNSETAKTADTELYFCTGAYTYPAEQAVKRYDAIPAHGYTTARVDIGGLKAWGSFSGTIRGIRYDVFQNANIGDVMYIDSVILNSSRIPGVEISNARAAAHNGFPVDPETDLICTTYENAKYTSPYWKGNIVYNEAVSPIQNDDGGYTYKLMYEPEEIIAVYDGAFNIYFEEGVDFEVNGNELTILEDGRINTFLLNDIKNWNYDGDRVFFTAFLNVTYTHNDTWDYYVPESKADKLPNFTEALKNNSDYKIAFFGDSLTGGANSSSYRGYYPNAPFWWEQIEDALRGTYGFTNLSVYDLSEGGSSASGMIDKFWDYVVPEEPDMIFIEFGVNDAQNEAVSSNPSTSNLKNEYKNALEDMILLAMEENSDVEIVLVAPFYSHIYNYDMKYFDVCRDACLELEDEYDNVVTVNMTDLNGSLFEVKRHYDLTGDNVCHPNDFMSRFFAQASLATIISEEIGYEAYIPVDATAPVIESITADATSIELEGSVTYTANVSGENLTYAWDVSALPEGVTCTGTDTSTLTVTVDKLIEESFSAKLVLTVTNTGGASVVSDPVDFSYTGAIYGDLNGDEMVTLLDVFYIKLMIKQINTPDAADLVVADIDNNGVINMLDSFAIKYRIKIGEWA